MLRTVAVCVSKALVAGVSAVVDSVADVGRVDALAAGQTLECAVAGRRCSRRAGHRHPRFAVLHAPAAAAATNTSGTHRVCPAGRLLVTVGRPLVSRRSAANSAPLPPLPLICRPTQTHSSLTRLTEIVAGHRDTDGKIYEPTIPHTHSHMQND